MNYMKNISKKILLYLIGNYFASSATSEKDQMIKAEVKLMDYTAVRPYFVLLIITLL